MMKYHYPTPAELGIEIPPTLLVERFNRGFLHALKGEHLTGGEHFRLSFREGYRMGKFYLTYLRKQMGILEFPMKSRMKFKNVA